MIKRFLLSLFLLSCLAASAEAANRFWVGGTGTWDGSTTTHWSATTGGGGGATVPGSADSVIFDASSGGGTVTVNTTVTVQDITMGAFTGTLDFSANNNNVTLSSDNGFQGTGTGVRTLNLGNGTWTLTSIASVSTTPWSLAIVTNLTFNANNSTIKFSATTVNQRNFASGSLTYHNLTIDANSSLGNVAIGGVATFANITMTAPSSLAIVSGATTTATSLTMAGSSGNALYLSAASKGGSAAILSVASGTQSLSWVGIRDITFTGGATFTATNSFNLGANTGITFAGSGGGCILGGWLLWRDFDPANDNVPAFLDRVI